MARTLTTRSTMGTHNPGTFIIEDAVRAGILPSTGHLCGSNYLPCRSNCLAALSSIQRICSGRPSVLPSPSRLPLDSLSRYVAFSL